MYPVGLVPGDVTISVYDIDGNGINNATVVATLTSASPLVPVDTQLASGVGILPTSVVSQTAGRNWRTSSSAPSGLTATMAT